MKRKIFVAGHNGLAGKAICKSLANADNTFEVLTTPRSELDLVDSVKVSNYFMQKKPRAVVICAAKVGGIVANNSLPVDFLHDNLKIQLSIIEAAHQANVETVVFLGSSCIYPRNAPQPMPERCLLEGALELTNRPYAIAKIAGIESIWSYNRQYGRKWYALMPTNLYGCGDNYHPEHSHVLPALLRRIHEAKLNKSPSVIVWGTGQPRREFMYADDLGDAVRHSLSLDEFELSHLFNNNEPPILNVGTGTDISIKELALVLKETVGYDGEIVFDTTRPDGTPRKLLDVSRIHALGWRAKSDFTQAVQMTYSDFLKNTKRL
jgi:GDP-L-fucose synthase